MAHVSVALWQKQHAGRCGTLGAFGRQAVGFPKHQGRAQPALIPTKDLAASPKHHGTCQRGTVAETACREMWHTWGVWKAGCGLPKTSRQGTACPNTNQGPCSLPQTPWHMSAWHCGRNSMQGDVAHLGRLEGRLWASQN